MNRIPDPETHLLNRVAESDWESLSTQDQALVLAHWGSEAIYRSKRQAVVAARLAMAAPAIEATESAAAWQRLLEKLPQSQTTPVVAPPPNRTRSVWWAAAVLLAGIGFGAGWFSRPTPTGAPSDFAATRDTVFIANTVRDTVYVPQHTVQTVYQTVADCPEPNVAPQNNSIILGKSYPAPIQAPPMNALLFAEARLGANQYGISLADDSARHPYAMQDWEPLPLGQ